MFLLDTDTLSLLRRGNGGIVQRIAQTNLANIGTTIISVEEQLTGWQALLRQTNEPSELAKIYAVMTDTVQFLSGFEIFSFTEAAILRHHKLLTLKLNIGKMDLRIAAIALENNATLVTRNFRDFTRVPNLTIENWAD